VEPDAAEHRRQVELLVSRQRQTRLAPLLVRVAWLLRRLEATNGAVLRDKPDPARLRIAIERGLAFGQGDGLGVYMALLLVLAAPLLAILAVSFGVAHDWLWAGLSGAGSVVLLVAGLMIEVADVDRMVRQLARSVVVSARLQAMQTVSMSTRTARVAYVYEGAPRESTVIVPASWCGLTGETVEILVDHTKPTATLLFDLYEPVRESWTRAPDAGTGAVSAGEPSTLPTPEAAGWNVPTLSQPAWAMRLASIYGRLIPRLAPVVDRLADWLDRRPPTPDAASIILRAPPAPTGGARLRPDTRKVLAFDGSASSLVLIASFVSMLTVPGPFMALVPTKGGDVVAGLVVTFLGLLGVSACLVAVARRLRELRRAFARGVVLPARLISAVPHVGLRGQRSIALTVAYVHEGTRYEAWLSYSEEASQLVGPAPEVLVDTQHPSHVFIRDLYV
jgi:hypothetical protein